jgi:hypothetical protein
MFDDLIPKAQTTRGYGDAISSIESGGNYQSIGPETGRGRALGKYQVMPSNVGPWTKEALGQELTPEQFLASPEAQDAVFKHRFGQYVQKYGPEGAARAWFAGEKGMNNPEARDVLGTSVSDYSQKFIKSAGLTEASSQARKPSPTTELSFDDLIPQQNTAEPEMQGPPRARVGMVEAIMRGVNQGVSLNMGDEVAGLRAASGIPGNMGGIPGAIQAGIGAARMGYDYLTGGTGAQDAYTAKVEAEREANRQAQEQRPYSYIGGNVAGAAVLPGGQLMQAATLPMRVARGAAVGSAFGAGSGAGEGEGIADRAQRAAIGGGIGAIVGGAVPVAATAVEGIGRGIGAALSPVTNRLRGAVSPEAQGARTTAEYLGKGTPELTLAEFRTAQAAGQPVANIERGGEAGRALARWASNVSPEARETIQKFANDRFEGQGERAIQFLQNIAGTSGNTTVLRDALKGLARIENRQAYAKAYSHPNAQGMWDEGFEQLAQAPVVQDAIRAASVTAANRGTMQGYQRIQSPFVIDKKTGQLSLRTDENGNRVLPNLEFWDKVKQNLDKVATPEAKMLNGALKAHLDDLVPDYKKARAGAAHFFDADDAITAGQNFVNQNMALGDAAKALSKMSPTEREMFKIGFASKLIDDIGNTRDRVNVMSKIGQSENARTKLKMVLGENGYRQIESFVAVEQSMDKLRTALGNSTTVRQWVELGLAGGVGGSGLVNADPTQLGLAAAIAGRRYVDQRVAREVARMLTSSDPDVLAKGISAVSRNKNLLRAFRDFDARLSGAASQQGSMMQIQNPVRADSEQPSSR